MATVKNKKKNTDHSQKKSSNADNEAIPWPNLPKRLIKHIALHRNALETINFGLATKSWGYFPPHCHRNSGQTQPRLVVVSDEKPPEKFRQVCDIEFPQGYWWYWYERRRPMPHSKAWTHFLGCSHGVLFAATATPSRGEIFLFHPKEHWTDKPPACDEGNGHHDIIPFQCAAFSSAYRLSADESCVLMVATGVSSPAFMFCRLGKKRREWVNKECTVPERNWLRSKRPNGEGFMRFTNAIGFKGKFYALSSQGTVAVIEEISHDCFDIATLGKTRAVPSVPAKGFRECLIESDGEILLVFLVHGKNMNVVDGVEVYRLRFDDDLSWAKMESLGEQRTLFVGNDCCVSVYAEKVGCRGNRVYFMQPRGVSGDWWEFDMENETISRPDWVDRVNDNGGNGNPLEWDKPIASKEDEDEKWWRFY